MIIDINEEKARKKISKIHGNDWQDPKKTSCEIIDVKNYRVGNVLIEDLCNCNDLMYEDENEDYY